jgi:hypothetical protein
MYFQRYSLVLRGFRGFTSDNILKLVRFTKTKHLYFGNDNFKFILHSTLETLRFTDPNLRNSRCSYMKLFGTVFFFTLPKQTICSSRSYRLYLLL